jgi:hypothetical protein
VFQTGKGGRPVRRGRNWPSRGAAPGAHASSGREAARGLFGCSVRKPAGRRSARWPERIVCMYDRAHPTSAARAATLRRGCVQAPRPLPRASASGRCLPGRAAGQWPEGRPGSGRRGGRALNHAPSLPARVAGRFWQWPGSLSVLWIDCQGRRSMPRREDSSGWLRNPTGRAEWGLDADLDRDAVSGQMLRPPQVAA